MTAAWLLAVVGIIGQSPGVPSTEPVRSPPEMVGFASTVAGYSGRGWCPITCVPTAADLRTAVKP